MHRRSSPHRENWAAWVSPQAVKRGAMAERDREAAPDAARTPDTLGLDYGANSVRGERGNPEERGLFSKRGLQVESRSLWDK